MASISDILMARGAAQANAASRRGNIYADLIRQSTSAPGQVAQQLRADQREQAQDEETKARLGLAQGQLQYQQSALADQQAQQARNQAGSAALSTAIQAHTTTDPETGHVTIDHDAVYKDASAVSPEIADHWYKSATEHLKLTNEIQNDTLAAQQRKAQLSANIAGSVLDAPPEQRAAAYDAARTNALTLYKDVPEIGGAWAKLPPTYSPALDATLTPLRDSSTTQAQKAEAALKKAQEGKTAADTKKVEAETAQIGKPPVAAPMSEYQRVEAARSAAGLAETIRHNQATEAGKTGPQEPLGVKSDAKMTAGGVPYVDLSKFKGKDYSQAQKEAKDAGVFGASAAEADALDQINTARTNMAEVNRIIDKLPESGFSPTRLLQRAEAATGIGDPDFTTLKTNTDAAIQAMRAVAGSKGLRLNKDIINQSVQNNIPAAGDTQAVAKEKARKFAKFLDDQEKTILGNHAAAAAPAATPTKIGRFEVEIAP